jgi:hypothetical protein
MIVLDIKSGADCPTARYQTAAYEQLLKEREPKGVLNFYEATHEYRLDGVLLPSVTKILEDVGLSDYSMVPNDQLEKYQERGQRVHEITRLWDLGDLDESSLNEAGRRYLESWIKFRKKHIPHSVAFSVVERPLASGLYRYAGTPDRAFENGGRSERWVVYLSPEGEEARLVRCKDKTDWSVFLSAKNVYHAKHKN